jgi:hypothetical protein
MMTQLATMPQLSIDRGSSRRRILRGPAAKPEAERRSGEAAIKLSAFRLLRMLEGLV